MSLYSSSSTAAMAGDDLEAAAGAYEQELMRHARGAEAVVVEAELEASVPLLDACAAALDALRAMRACAVDLELALRRGGGHAQALAATRACARKARADVLAKSRHRHCQGQTSTGHGARSLEEARRVAAAALERVMTKALPSASRNNSRRRWWPACCVAVKRKAARVACEEQTTADLLSSSSKDEARALGETMEQLEQGVELLFRRLLQCRAFLLNLCSS